MKQSPNVIKNFSQKKINFIKSNRAKKRDLKSRWWLSKIRSIRKQKI